MKIIIESSEKLRIDQYLSEYFDEYSRSKLSKIIKSGHVTVNNKIVKPSYLISKEDIVDIDLEKLKIPKILPEDLDIEVIYEDNHIAVINKPKGIISHPTSTIRTNTVVNFLLKRFKYLSYINGDERPGIVHRLDKDTSGLMIVALTDEAMINLKAIFQNREIVKKYRAIVNHPFSQSNSTVEANISRSKSNPKLMSVDESGKYALTSYEVIKQTSEYAYLNIDLHTGRTHQIRVHMNFIGHPILGDRDYNRIKSPFNISCQLLQAYYLNFNHPITNENLSFEISMYPEFEKYYNLIF